MARKLPWKRDSEVSSSTPSGSRSVSKAGTSRTGSPSLPALGRTPQLVQDALRTPLSRRHERVVLDSDPIRSPSTSPPPEKPEEKFMIPGPFGDDKYRMVEDEFLHIANRFTAHLHRAEYERLKAVTRTQNAATIREIERPIVASTAPTRLALKKQESMKRLAKQRRALREAAAAGSGSAQASDALLSPWAGSGLHGLMDAPRREAKTIMPPVNGGSDSSRTRAAAGFDAGRSSPPRPISRRARDLVDESPSSSTTRLATPSQRLNETPAKNKSLTRPSFQSPATTYSSSPQRSAPRISSSTRTPATDGKSSNSRQRSTPSSESRHGKRPASVLDFDDDNDDDPFGLHERRLNRQKSREQFRRPEAASSIKTDIKQAPKKVNLDAIPSFL